MIPLIAAALYGMAGYNNKKAMDRENARQDLTDTQNSELHAARMADIAEQQRKRQNDIDYEDSLKVVGSAGKQDKGFQVTDIAGSNAFTKDPDASGMMADMSATKNEGTQTQDATRVSTGRMGATMQGTVAGSKVFADPAQAGNFSKTQTMSDYNQLKARQDVANQFGKMDVSDDIRSKLMKLESEGAFKALSQANAGDLEGAAATWNSTGNNRLPEGSKFIASTTTDPTTKAAKKVISLVGADGKTIVPDLDQAARAYLTPDQQDKSTKNAAETEHLAAQAEKERAYAEYLRNGGAPGAKAAASGDGPDKPFKMDEDAKLRMKDASTKVSDAEAMVAKSLTGLMGEDPAKSPGVVYAQKLLQEAKKNQLKTHIEIGVTTPDMMVTGIMGAAKSPTEVFKSLRELHDTVGADFADKVASQIQSNDTWLQMVKPTKQEPAPQPATMVKTAAPKALAPAPAKKAAAPQPSATMASAAQPKAAPAVAAPKPVSTTTDAVNPDVDLSALKQKWLRAKAGGTPLNQFELFKAKQAGFTS